MNGGLEGVSVANYVAAADRETLVDPGEYVLQSRRRTLCCRLVFSDSSALIALEDGELLVLSEDTVEACSEFSPKARGGVDVGSTSGDCAMVL